jgi:hypothetical protein
MPDAGRQALRHHVITIAVLEIQGGQAEIRARKICHLNVDLADRCKALGIEAGLRDGGAQ